MRFCCLGLVAAGLFSYQRAPPRLRCRIWCRSGPIRRRWAGLGVADSTGYEATYQNPAGLATGARDLTLGMVYGGYRTTVDGAPYPIEDTLAWSSAARSRCRLGASSRTAWASAWTLPTGFVNRVRVPLPEIPRHPAESRTRLCRCCLGPECGCRGVCRLAAASWRWRP